MSKDLGANHSVLLFYNNARGLSRGNVTKNVQEICRELKEFFQQSNKCENLDTLSDSSFVLSLVCLADIFDAALNVPNQSLQGREVRVCEFIAKFKAFIFGCGAGIVNLIACLYSTPIQKCRDLSVCTYICE